MSGRGWDGAMAGGEQDLPAWIRDMHLPVWLRALNDPPKVDGERMLTELAAASDHIEKRRAAGDRRRAAERRAGEAAWERAHQERDGRLPIAASMSWWAARPPVSI